MPQRLFLRPLTLGLILGLCLPAARAELVASSHYHSLLAFYDPVVAVPLRPDGGTELVVQVTQGGPHVIGFSAGCSAAGRDLLDLGGVQLDISVNGQVAPTTSGNLDTFCTVNTLGAFRPGMASVLVPVRLGEGENRIRVKARLQGEALGGQINSPTILVWR
jgi:hypothetical protein